jgi:hypothetical protein
MASNIPKAREILDDVMENLEALEPHQVKHRISVALNHMTRSSPANRASVKSNPITDEILEKIRALGHEAVDLDLSQQDIANAVGVNPGRVSEVLRGRR